MHRCGWLGPRQPQAPPWRVTTRAPMVMRGRGGVKTTLLVRFLAKIPGPGDISSSTGDETVVAGGRCLALTQ